MPSTRYCTVPAISGFRETPGATYHYYGTGVLNSSVGSGPAGSSSMVFFCVINPFEVTTAGTGIFGRSNLAGSGWAFYGTGGNIYALVYNSGGGAVQVASSGWPDGYGKPYIAFANYQNGTLNFYLNKTLVGTISSGSGFLANTNPVIYGARTAAATFCTNAMLADCGMLYSYDPTTYTSALYGNGITGLIGHWQDDLRNGRYLTWPRTGVANQDWYWASRDVAALTPGPTWTDRYTGTAMTRYNLPQGASFAPGW